MLEGSCHCGAARWQLAEMPESATACSCTACRRYGALWAYGYEGETIRFSGPTTAYVRGDSAGGSLSFNFCPRCGGVTHWYGLSTDDRGRRRVAVNLRMTAPGPIAHLPIDHFDGLDKWEDQPRDGRCIQDMWF
jgi:hypothetical protein